MSSTVDNRVVEMRFDNKQFESNVKTSIGTLGKLKQSLNLSGAAKGLDSVNTAAKKVNFSGMNNAIDTVKVRFSALETMAVTALANITNSAVNAGKRMVAAFTIDPIKTGLAEYETQINAIQTILANTESKGTTLTDVNAALDELNTYADKTIYNFTEMTRNIGTFTAAGVDLDKSVAAIKGIANLAAVSGSNSQQASTAMYQLSQALASGTVKLMDWNSVVNAGMGGQVFQDALKETARVHGIKIDEMIKKQGSFRETLSEGWLSSEVLLETLQKFTGDLNEQQLKAMGYTEEQIKGILQLGQTANDAATKVKTFTQLMDTLKESAQSGWTNTWEILFGDFGEAKTMWTAVSDALGTIINNSAEARNELLGAAFDSPWKKLNNALNENGVSIEEYQKRVKDVSKSHGKDLDALIKEYGSFEKAVRSGAVGADVLKESLKGVSVGGEEVSAKLDKINGTLKRGANGDDVKQLEAALKSLGYELQGVYDGKNYADDGYFGTLTEAAIKDFQKLNGLKVTGIVDDETLAAIKKATTKTTEFGKAVEGVDEIIDGITDLGGREIMMESFANIWKGIIQIAKPLGEAFRGAFKPLTPEKIYGFIESFHKLTEKFKVSSITALHLKKTFRGFFDVFGIGWDFIKELSGSVWNFAKKILPGMGEGILTVTSKVGLWITELRRYIQENKLFAAAIDAVGDFLGKAADRIKAWYGRVKVFFTSDEVKEWWSSFKNTVADSANKVWEQLKGAGKHFSEFFKKLKEGDFSSVKAGFQAFRDTIVNFFKDIDFKGGFENVVKSIKGFWSKIKEYFAGIGIDFDLLGSKISGFFQGIKQWFTNNGGALIALGLLTTFFLGVRKITKIVSTFTDPFGGIIEGFEKLAKAASLSIKAEAIKTMATAIAILAGSVVALALIPRGDLVVAVGAVIALGTALGVLTIVLNKMTDTADFTKLATSVLGLAGALFVFAVAAKMIGQLDASTLLKAGFSLAGLLTAIWLFSKGMSKVGTINVGGIGKTILAMAGSLLILAIAVRQFGKMDTGTLVKGGLAITVFLGEMVGIIALMGLISSKIGMGKNITKVGGAIAGMCASLLLLAVAVGIFGHMDTGTLVKGGLAITVFLTTMVGIIALVSKVGTLSANIGKVGLTMLGFAAALIAMAGAIAILSIIDTGKLIKASLALGAVTVIFAGLVAVSKFAGTGVSGTIYAMCAAIGTLAVSLVALSFVDTKKLTGATVALSAIIGMLSLFTFTTKFIPAKALASLIGMTVVIAAVGGVLYLLGTLPAEKNIASIAATLGITLAGLAAICATLGKLPAVGSLKGALVAVGVLGIISAGIAGVVTGFVKLTKWLSADFIDIGKNLSSFMKELGPFLDGASKLTPEVTQGITGLADMVMTLSKANFIDGISTWITKKSALDRFGDQLVPFGENIKKFVSAFDGVSINAEQFDTIIGGVSKLADVAAKLPKDEFIEVPFFSYESTTNIKEFGDFIANIGPVMTDMATGLKNANVNANDLKNVSSVCASVNTLADAASSIPTSTSLNVLDGLIRYSETPDFAGFNEWIAGVVPQMTALATTVKDAKFQASDLANVKTICESVKFLGEAVGNTPDIVTGVGVGAGPWGFIAGGFQSIPDLTGFSSWIATVSSQMVGLLGIIKGSNFEKSDFEGVKTICESVKLLGEAVEHAPATTVGGGLGFGPWGFIAGGFASIPDLTGFTNWISRVIPKMEHLATTVDGLSLNKSDYGNITTLLESVTSLGTAIESTPGIRGGAAFANVGPVIAGVLALEIPNISGFANWIEKVVPQMESLATTIDGLSLTDADYDGISAILESVSSLGTAVQNTPGIHIGGGLAMVGPVIAAVAEINVPNIKGFANWIEKVVPQMESLATTVDGLSLTSTDYEGISTILGAIPQLSTAVSSTPAVEITAAATTIGGYVNVKVPNMGGFAEFIKTCVTEMSKLPEVVAETTVDQEGIAELCANVKTLAEAAKLVPTTEMGAALTGFGAGVYVKSTDLQSFVDWICPVMDSLQTAATKLSSSEVTIDTNMVTAVAQAGKVLAEMAKALPETTSWLWGAFETGGSGSWDDFGNNVVAFGEVIKKLSENVTGQIDESAVSTVATAGKLLAEMGAIIGEGAIAELADTTLFETFKENVMKFATTMTEFSSTVADIDDGSVNASSNAITAIMGVLTSISTMGIGSIDTATFSTKATELGSAVGAFHTAVGGVDVSGSVAQINSLVTTLTSLNGQSFDGTGSFKSALENLATTSIDAVTTAFANGNTEVTEAAKSMVSAFGTGITDNAATATDAASTMSSDSATSAEGGYDGFVSAGSYMVDGFAAGISANTFKAAAKASAMATAAKEAAEAALGIKSPSRVAYGIGSFFGEGFVNALGDYESKTYRAGGDMADSARLGLSKAISRVQETIDSGLDGQPTIRPVLDLTDVQAGTDAMGRMFGLHPSVGVMTNAHSINSMMNRNQNGGNRDVVSAIKDLGRNIENKSGDTYQFGNITYDGDSAVADAVRVLVNAAKMERRT